MADTIRGPVTRIIDDKSFCMKVKFTGKDNKNKYNGEEVICISRIDLPGAGHPDAQAQPADLAARIDGKEVRCFVQSRDLQGRLVSEVKLL